MRFQIFPALKNCDGALSRRLKERVHVRLSGSTGSDVFSGSSEADSAYGRDGNDTLISGDGTDTLIGGGGSDSLDGGAGDDILYSGDPIPRADPYYTRSGVGYDRGNEPDTLKGGDGSDVFYVGYGDSVDGGADGPYGDLLNISFQGAPTGISVDFRLTTQNIGDAVITGIENVSYVEGSNYDDTIIVNSPVKPPQEFSIIHGMGGNDKISIGLFSERAYGDDGNDLIDARANIWFRIIDGGNGADTIYTNEHSQGVIYGGAGNDVLYSHGGTSGGAGDDTITMAATTNFGGVSGDEGNDLIIGATTKNYVVGGAGADTISGNIGADTLYSAETSRFGEDSGDAGLERDQIVGGAGDDYISIGYGDDADGGDGVDQLSLSLAGYSSGVTFDTSAIIGGQSLTLGGGFIKNFEGLAQISGTNFDDVITLQTQNSVVTVTLGGGNDVIIAKGSAVNVDGGAGDDRFVSGAGADTFAGQAGFNTVDYGQLTAGGTVNLATGQGAGGDQISGIQGAIGSSFADTIVGYKTAPTLLHGGAGNDSLQGGSGDSTLFGDDGDDNLVVDDGRNYIRGDDGNDLVSGGSGFDDINGNKGNDTAHGNAGDDWVVGGQANDLLFGDIGDDIVYGNLGNDTCYGGAGNDQIRGGQTDDLLYGEDGNDWLSGDRGNDTIFGGVGADIFHTWSDAGIDRVLDFSQAEGDRVLVDAGSTYTISQIGSDTAIDFGAGNQMILVGVKASSLVSGWIFTQ